MIPVLRYVKARYLGLQEWPKGCKERTLILYNLLEPIPGHAVNSTVDLLTLAGKGYHPQEVI